MTVSANAYEQRAARLLTEVHRMTCELIGDRPELNSARWADMVEKIGALEKRFKLLSADIRRVNAQVDMQVAGLSRYVRGQSRQAMFRDAQALVQAVRAPLKTLSDLFSTPTVGDVANGVHSLIEEFSKTAENLMAKPATTKTHAGKTATGTSITISPKETVDAFPLQQSADILLMFGLLLGTLYRQLKAKVG